MIVTIIIIIIINVFIILKICMENVPYKIKVEKCGKRAIVVTFTRERTTFLDSPLVELTATDIKQTKI